MIVVGALGRGVGSESPVARVVEKYRPDRVILIASKESLPKIKDFAAHLGSKYDELDVKIVQINDPDSPIDVLREMLRSIGSADVVDITAGTKAMSVALALFALKKGARITYVSGMRDSETGRVISGTEEVREYDVTELAGEICGSRQDK